MPQEENYPIQPDELIHAFSLERFGRYMERAGEDQELALALYALNTQLSEAFIPHYRFSKSYYVTIFTTS